MDDLTKIGGKYEAAQHPSYSPKDHVQFIFSFLWMLLKTIVDYVPHLIRSVRSIFVWKKPKIVYGQLALGELMIRFNLI
jgi:hypothetical protein